MITPQEIANLIWSLLSILALWWLHAKAYRSYRVDLFRERLFTLRDRLFDLARDGNVGFDDPSYIMLRQALNGFIRFAEKLQFLSIAIYLYQLRPTEMTLEAEGSFLYRWEKLRDQRSPAFDKEVQDIVMRMHITVIGHVIMTSLLLFSLIVPLIFYVLAKYTANRAVRPVYDYCRKFVRSTAALDAIDSQAFDLGART